MELDIYFGAMHGRPEKTIGKWFSIYNDLQH